MRLRSAIPAIAISTIAWSACKKDSSISLGAVYHKTSIEPAGDIRVFSQSGEIKNSIVVSRLIANDSAWINDMRLYFLSNSGDSIQMLDNENAKIREASGYVDYKVTSSDRDLIFTAKDTSTSTSAGEVYSKSIPYYLSFYKPAIYYEYIISSTRGNYEFGYTTKTQLVFTKPVNRFVAPSIAVIIQKPGNVNSAFVQNKPDYSFYHSLAATDTVVLREYSLIYVK